MTYIYMIYVENRFWTIWCCLLQHRVWHHILHNLPLKVKPIWLPVVRQDGITMFKLEIWWIYITFGPKQWFVCIYTTFICLYTSCWAFTLVIFPSFVQGCQLNWIHWDMCSKTIVNVDRSSRNLVYRLKCAESNALGILDEFLVVFL